jgi:hypothetical protein
VAPDKECPFCKNSLWIVETRVRHVQSLDKLIRLELKGKRCSSDSCEHRHLRYRPSEEGRLVLKGHEFGLDVVILAGEQHLRQNASIPRIHKHLRDERRISICERSVGNLIDDYVALCECVAGDTDRLRARLAKQGGIVLSIDGVQYDDRSPVLYVQRDVLSGEVLYGERRLARAAEDLLPMLERTRDLARDLGIPILGVVSDKERSLVPAIAKVFKGIPHQYCHTHCLKNVAEPVEEEARTLEEAAREVVTALRDVERRVERQGAGQEVTAEVRPAPACVEKTPALDAPPGPSGTAPAAMPDAQVAAALARAGTTVGKVSGRPILEPAGLKRFQRLEEVRRAAEMAARKKGGPRKAAGL